MLIVQAADAESTLQAGLEARRHAVTAVRPYRAVARRVEARDQLTALAADAVLFASGSAARAWAAAMGTATPPVVVVIGPQTAAATRAAGLPVTAVARESSIEGMLDALDEVLAPGTDLGRG